MAARRRLADRDERVGVPSLDAVVDGPGDRRVDRGSHRVPLDVELRRKELLQVRLVPGRVEADGRVARVLAGIALYESLREIFQVLGTRRGVIRAEATVRPGRRAPDRDQ
jgi:hypothetical protein